ncbi:glycosyltransferase 87 family protein [Streptomyces sp. NPDC088353]|uniref:glycosyltransferase 87 family protein n=1 Tax=Streptomyces sp. NPDC088353 TaxID=3365855 RepID=UPI003817B0D1
MQGIWTRSRGIGQWLTGHAGWCLAVSLAVHVAAVVTHPTHPLDLRVYREAAPHVLSGGLYDYALRTTPPIPRLPFTYPPFAALVFLPLARLPWAALVALWQSLSVAALVVVAVCAVRLLGPRPGGRVRRRALLWAAAGLWLEPVRHTLDQGQVNLLLGAVVLWGLAVPRAAPGRGAGVGLAAAVKLTPAVGGLYLLATRQWRAAAWAVTVAAAATALAWGVAPRESARYWSTLVTDTGRVGPVWSVRNQSLSGAVARLLGQDTTAAVVLWSVLALVTVALVCALRSAARRHDLLGVLVAVELYGLLVSPVSWSHHWIWCLPAMIWLAHGPLRGRLLSRVALAWWAVVTVARVVPFLIGAEDHLVHPGAYPALLAWPGCVYAGCAVLTLAAVALRPAGHDRPVLADGKVPERDRSDVAGG